MSGEPIGGLQLVVLGLFILSVAWIVRRGIGRRRRPPARSMPAEARDEVRHAREAESRIRELEVRLYDYERDIEGRIETRLSLLDRLIAEADREVEHLQQLLQRRSGTGVNGPAQRRPDILDFPGAENRDPLSQDPAHRLKTERRRTIRHLKESGYSVEQIARLVECSPDDVRNALDDGADRDHRDAA